MTFGLIQELILPILITAAECDDRSGGRSKDEERTWKWVDGISVIRTCVAITPLK